MASANDFAGKVLSDGFAIVPNVLTRPEVQHLISVIERIHDPQTDRSPRGVYAIRNLLDVTPEIQKLALSRKIQVLTKPLLGEDAFPVRGLLFDKTPRANWRVAWHQDLSITVENRIDMPGFGPWSVKAGAIHVEPPPEILEQMLTVRVHLDNSGPTNGALRVIPGSHTRGRLNRRQVHFHRQIHDSICCSVEAGGVLLMRPLLLHASSSSDFPNHRRVIHLEFASGSLPGGLRWLSARISS